MKAHLPFSRIPRIGMAVVLASLLFPGCATTKKVDWNSRMGNFTYDQAVAELGPPDKTATLGNGSTVADWISRRSGGGGFSIGVGSYGSHTGVGVGQTIDSGYSERILRLTFGPDGQLTGSNRQGR